MSISFDPPSENNRSGRKRNGQQHCPTNPCTQPKLEDYMNRVLTLMLGMDKVHEIFEYHEVVEIIHGCLTIFADEPTLLQFPVPENGLVVIGDLHGDEYCFLRALQFYGLPPDTSYLFLGDFVDRGRNQNEVLLFVLLMKLRWPEYVYILRGNHESVIRGRTEFKARCLVDYDTKHAFPQLLQLFDYIPLCAIVSDYFLICHGGISQWMTCRANIMNIKRPTDLDNMTILEGALVADILWADPDPEQELPFEGSSRGVSYCFNQEALHAVLRALNVQKLIHGHLATENGVEDDFGDGTSITVHTTNYEEYGSTKSGTIKIIRDANGEYEIESRMVQEEDRTACVPAWIAVRRTMNANFERHMLNRVAPECQWCQKKIPKNILKRRRWTGPIEALQWIQDYAYPLAKMDRHLRDAFKTRNKIEMYEWSYTLFPSIYDLYALHGADAAENDPCTFRVLVFEEEKTFMLRCNPHARNFEISETLANDVDPRLQHIKYKKLGLLTRVRLRITNPIRHVLGLPSLRPV